MLFNRTGDNSTTIQEFRKFASFIFASNKFEDIKLDVELAEEELIKLIGNDLYLKADTHYNGAEFEVDNPTPTQLFNDRLVYKMQLPVALESAFNYTIQNDVSHTKEGRKVAIGQDEKMAWEWMLEKDDRATLKKLHKSQDRLIQFLEDNEDSIPEWKNSESQQKARSLFINSAADFDDGFPIDSSRRFFLVLISFMEYIENKVIKTRLGKDLFDEIKLQIKNGNLTERNQETLNFYIKPALRHLTMSRAIKMLAIQVLPEGVYQNYISDRLTQNTKKPADSDVRREVSIELERDGESLLKDLEEHLTKLAADDLEEEYEVTATTPRDYSGQKFFRT